MTLYVDRFLLINTCMNLLIIYITKIIVRSKASFGRIIANAFLGGVFALIITVVKFFVVAEAFINVLFSVLLVFLCFKPKNTKDFLRITAAFYIVSFAVGGCAFAILNTAPPTNTFFLLFFTSIVSFFIITLITEIYEKYYRIDTQRHLLEVVFMDKILSVECFYDTGNTLIDPVSKLPVAVVESKVLLPVIFNGKRKLPRNTEELYELFLHSEIPFKLKLIPFSSVGGGGLLPGFVPDRISVDGNCINAIIAVSFNPLSSEGECKAIINPQLIL